MIRTLLIDDEAKARRILESLLTEYCPEIEIVGTADDVPTAVEQIKILQPDLVFLDIEMPGELGFELVNYFDSIDFDITFTTAYSEYALKAFEISAIDYLLKPIQIEQLQKAVAKVIDKNPQQTKERLQALKENIAEPRKLSKIALPVAEGLLFVKPDEIIYLRAESSYTRIFLTHKPQVLVSKTLKEFERLLDFSDIFLRVHRSYIINLNHIASFVRADGGSIIMDNNESVHISKDKKDELLKIFREM